QLLEGGARRHVLAGIRVRREIGRGQTYAGIVEGRRIAGGRREQLADGGRAEHVLHGATQQQVVDRTPLHRDLGGVGAARQRVLRVAVAQGHVQRTEERHVLQDRDIQLCVGFLRGVTTLQRR